MFSPDELSQIEQIKARYPHQKAALMPVLWMAQKKLGWISDETMEYVANLLGLSKAHVLGVVTFYTMYFDKPMGRHHIQVCTNVSCMLRGGDKIYDDVKKQLGIGHMQCTPDGKYSLEEVECMGACGGAPMIAVNEEFFENATIASAAELLRSLR